jgi:hypothetical protein
MANQRKVTKSGLTHWAIRITFGSTLAINAAGVGADDKPVAKPLPTPTSTAPETSKAAEPAKPVTFGSASEELEALVKLMTGSFSSEEQSKDKKATEEYFDIRLHMTRIWSDAGAGDGVWLYVEQAMSSALDKPYRQRIYWVTIQPFKGPDGKEHVEFRSEVYLLPGEALKYAGAWKDMTKLEGVKPDDLKVKDGCAVILRRTSDGVYHGGTVGTNCPSDRAGAVYATSLVHIAKDGLKTWDRGYDKDGEQVWGAKKGGYVFKRVGE